MGVMPDGMTQEEFEKLMERVYTQEINSLRKEGQKEYAHEGRSAFANFDRLARDLEMDRKKVLWVYAMKHRDGIASWLKGHKTQREDVRGRINDLIVYLFLLRGMIECEEGDWTESNDKEPAFLTGLQIDRFDYAPDPDEQLPTPKGVSENLMRRAEEEGISYSPPDS